MSKAAPKKGGAPVVPPVELPAVSAAPVVEAPSAPPPPPPVTYGSGRFVYADGSVYEGEYMVKDGAKFRHGKGRFAGPHFSYEGAWESDVMHGAGTYIGSLGAVYSGELRMGKYHGAGRYRWPDGATYEGPWVDGKLHGPNGQYVSAEGVLFAGEFINGLHKSALDNTLVSIR